MPGKALLRGTLLAIAVALAAVPAIAQAPALAMLDSLAHGGWDLRLRSGGDGSTQHICVNSGREFIQLKHRQANCQRFVVQDDPDQVTVQYTCRGDGYGRTTIRRESKGLVQIDSQGIKDGTPFSIAGEARYTGAC